MRSAGKAEAQDGDGAMAADASGQTVRPHPDLFSLEHGVLALMHASRTQAQENQDQQRVSGASDTRPQQQMIGTKRPLEHESHDGHAAPGERGTEQSAAASAAPVSSSEGGAADASGVTSAAVAKEEEEEEFRAEVAAAAVEQAKAGNGIVYLSNMSWWTTDAEVEAACSEFGPVVSEGRTLGFPLNNRHISSLSPNWTHPR